MWASTPSTGQSDSDLNVPPSVSRRRTSSYCPWVTPGNQRARLSPYRSSPFDSGNGCGIFAGPPRRRQGLRATDTRD
jgi:hypothetical protein